MSTPETLSDQILTAINSRIPFSYSNPTSTLNINLTSDYDYDYDYDNDDNDQLIYISMLELKITLNSPINDHILSQFINMIPYTLYQPKNRTSYSSGIKFDLFENVENITNCLKIRLEQFEWVEIELINNIKFDRVDTEFSLSTQGELTIHYFPSNNNNLTPIETLLPKWIAFGSNQQQIIATHNGTFHLDEVTAYTILNYLYPNNQLIRTRDPTLIATANLTIDVGGVYDANQGRYDHHQLDFTDTFNDQSQIKLSSAGLIWKHYGRQLIQTYCQQSKIDVYNLESTYYDLYWQIFAEIDAHDNGQRQYTDNFYDLLKNKTIRNHYPTNLNLISTITKLNTSDTANHTAQMTAFKKASDVVWTLFDIHLTHYFVVQNELTTDIATIANAYSQSQPTDRYLVVRTDCNNWRKGIQLYEDTHLDRLPILFLIYPNSNATWNIRTLSDQQFKSRQDLLPLSQLQKLVTCPDEITFIHTKLFIGASLTLETAIEMAQFSSVSLDCVNNDTDTNKTLVSDTLIV